MSHTIHSPSHNPGGCVILLCSYFDSRPMDKIVHGYERVYLSGDYVRGGLRYQDTRHSYFLNQV